MKPLHLSLFFTLPAGALADMTDRKQMMLVMTTGLAIAPGGLAITGWFHLISPWVLLGTIFLIGTGSNLFERHNSGRHIGQSMAFRPTRQMRH